MSAVLNLLTAIIAMIPATFIVGGIFAQAVIGLLITTVFGFVAMKARAADIEPTLRIIRSLKFTLAIPAAWIIIQLLPWPLQSSHPIWATVAPLLQKTTGHITIDIGMSVAALVSYLMLLMLGVTTVFVARDRRSADLILLALNVVITFLVFSFLVLKWFGPTALDGAAAPRLIDIMTATSVMGLIVVAAAITSGIERREDLKNQALTEIFPKLRYVLYLAALIIFIVGIIVSINANTAMIVTLAIAIFSAIQIMRRASQRFLSGVALLSTIAIAAAMIVFWRFDRSRPPSLFLQYATDWPAAVVAATQRMISDSGLLGAGAGTFPALLPAYQELGEAAGRGAPTTAAAFAIEMGWPITLIAIVIAIQLIVILMRGALRRRRDSFFAAGAASCMVAVLVQSFCDASLLHISVRIIISIIVGLGLAQSISRSESR